MTSNCLKKEEILLKQLDIELKDVMDKALNQHVQSVSFDFVWDQHLKNKHAVQHKKRLTTILIAVILTILVSGIGAYAGIVRNIDKTDYSFVDDPQVMGKWVSVDLVKKVNAFNPDIKSYNGGFAFPSLVFIKDGKMLIGTENGNLTYSSFSWTKGLILNIQDKTASKYTIKKINGTQYMFSEWKSGDYIDQNMVPHYYVLKKVDSDDYSNFQVGSVKIEDKIDYSFVDDPQMLGTWESVDFVKDIDSYQTGVKSWGDDLFLTGLTFDKEGKLIITTRSGSNSISSMIWTKGLIIDKEAKTASKCVIKEISEETYLFYECKNGDYICSGMTPYYYVLKKVK